MTSTKALVLLCDDTYIDQAKALFYNAKSVGQWTGDFALIYTGTRAGVAKDFSVRGIDVPLFPRLPFEPSPHFYKYYLFDPYFAKWDHVLYVDLDVMFTSPIDLFERNSFRGIYSNIDDLPLVQQFDCTGYDEFLNTGWDLTMESRFKEVIKSLGRNSRRSAFQSCFILFSTDMIARTTLGDLLALHERYYVLANSYTYEQAILNLYFRDSWKPLTLRMVNVYEHWKTQESLYDASDYGDKICIHFGRFQAPWKAENERFFPMWALNRKGFDVTDFCRSSKWPPPATEGVLRRLDVFDGKPRATDQEGRDRLVFERGR